LWQDAVTLSAAYLLQDAVGRPQVALTSLNVSLTLTGDGGSFILYCGLPLASSGKGDCAGGAPAAWFNSTSNSIATAVLRAAYGVTVVATSGAQSVALSRSPARTTIAAAGVFFALPASPRYRGNTVGPVTVYAHTGGYALSSWTLVFTYNTSVLTYSSYTSDAKFNLPTVNSGTPGTLSFAVTGKANGVTDSAVTGTAVSVLKVVFTVAAAAPVGVNARAMSAVVDLINTGTLTFVSQGAVSVGDDRDGWSPQGGQFTVVLSSPIGMYAYATSAELFNTGNFSGAAVTTAVTAMAVYGTPNAVTAPDTVLSTATCSLSDAAQSGVLSVAASAGGCTVSAPKNATAGAASVGLSISAGSFAFAGVSLRVWAPQSVDVYASDYLLSPISGASQTGACSSSLYQSAQLRLVAVFGGSGLQATPALDMTCTPGVTFASTNTSAVTVSGTTATGSAAGWANVYAVGSTAAPLQLTVGAQAVTVDSLAPYLLTGATFSGVPATVQLSASASFTANATLVQSLTAEGSSGVVAVYATFSDGMTARVTDGLNLTVRAAYASSLTLTTSGGNITATVAAGASRMAPSAAPAAEGVPLAPALPACRRRSISKAAWRYACLRAFSSLFLSTSSRLSAFSNWLRTCVHAAIMFGKKSSEFHWRLLRARAMGTNTSSMNRLWSNEPFDSCWLTTMPVKPHARPEPRVV
jgi:hypothetical protein